MFYTILNFFPEYIGYAPIRHKIVDISMSEISNERQGKIFESRILETLKLLPAFLAGYLVSYWPSYDFMKINIYLSQQKRNVLTCDFLLEVTNDGETAEIGKFFLFQVKMCEAMW